MRRPLDQIGRGHDREARARRRQPRFDVRRRELRAEIVGVDERSDVALLKVEADNLPTVRLGDSDQLHVGDWVLAIGSPFGFDHSATQGIVSALSRNLPDGTYVPFIQTDVAVNPGNSGGPLFNMKGEVIGINSQIFSRTGGYQGLSFSIPIDVAVKVQDQLVQYGKVTRGRIGVTIQGVNQALADSFGLKEPAGALVSQVEKGGPADKAGIEAGDVIVKLNGKAVQDSSELPAQIAELKPGASANLEIIRKGATKNVEVAIGTLKDNKVAAKSTGQAEKGRLGVAVRPLAPEEQKQAGGVPDPGRVEALRPFASRTGRQLFMGGRAREGPAQSGLEPAQRRFVVHRSRPLEWHEGRLPCVRATAGDCSKPPYARPLPGSGR